MIILLDLNYTLIANSHEKHKPFALQIHHETYRNWLVSLVAPYHTILMMARPEAYKHATLDGLYSKTGWVPRQAQEEHRKRQMENRTPDQVFEKLAEERALKDAFTQAHDRKDYAKTWRQLRDECGR